MTRWLIVAKTTAPTRRMPWEHVFQQHQPPPVAVPLAAAVRDEVVLCRPKYGGEIVAIGTIIEAVATEDTDGAIRRLLSRDAVPPEYAYQLARIEYHTLIVSAPLTMDHLRASGLQALVSHMPPTVAKRGIPPPEPVKLDVNEAEWSRLTQLAKNPPQPTDWPTAWHINPGEIVKRRRQVHDVYGGKTLARIAPSGTTPNVMVFINSDRLDSIGCPLWKEGMLHAIGHREYKHEFSAENLVMLEHANRGLALRVFQVKRRGCLYLGEFKIPQGDPLERWENTEQRDPLSHGTMDMLAPIVRLEPLDGDRALVGPLESKAAPRIELGLRSSVIVTKSQGRGKPNKPHRSADHDEASTIRKLRKILEQDPGAIGAVSALDDAQSVAMLIQYARRQADLTKLRSVIETSTTTEPIIQDHLRHIP
ncbi:MAG: hypothetical protein J2P17_16525 [Mycobacterium sp.]|nr:hypothetical protein [Mycobacterium sp.]